MQAARCRARRAKCARRTGRQVLEGVQGDCGKTRELGGLGMSTPERLLSGTDRGDAGGKGQAQQRGRPRGRGNDASSGGCAAPKRESEDGAVDTECMDPRRRAGHQIHVSSGRDCGIQHRRLMRVTRVGSRTKASGAGRSACPTPGATRGVWGDSGERHGPERGSSMRGIHRRTRRLATGAATEGAPGGQFIPFSPGPERARGGRAHGGDPKNAKPCCRVDQQAMRAVFRGNLARARRV